MRKRTRPEKFIAMQVRMTEAEHLAVKRWARRLGLTISTAVREMALAEAGNEQIDAQPEGAALGGNADVALERPVPQADAASVQAEDLANADHMGQGIADRSEPVLKNPDFKRHPKCACGKCFRLRVPCCALCAMVNR